MRTSKRGAPKPSSAQASSPRLTATCVYQDIDLSSLLEPRNPARESFDEAKLYELIESIKEVGILEPLIVQKEGSRFRIQAGHRRFVAGRAAGLRRFPCMMYLEGQGLGEAIKHHENKFREDLNCAEEARHFQNLLANDCGGDVDRLCALVRERRGYVEDRLLLIEGDPTVFQALSDSAISIGVASELNKVRDQARRIMYLEAAMQGGATVRVVRDWRMKGNADDLILGDVHLADDPNWFKPEAPALPSQMACYICESTDDSHDLDIMYVHRSCARAMQRLQEQKARVNAAPGGEH
jgi:ParB/RepB/Spo0J family partition protein